MLSKQPTREKERRGGGPLSSPNKATILSKHTSHTGTSDVTRVEHCSNADTCRMNTHRTEERLGLRIYFQFFSIDSYSATCSSVRDSGLLAILSTLVLSRECYRILCRKFRASLRAETRDDSKKNFFSLYLKRFLFLL